MRGKNVFFRKLKKSAVQGLRKASEEVRMPGPIENI